MQGLHLSCVPQFPQLHTRVTTVLISEVVEESVGPVYRGPGVALSTQSRFAALTGAIVLEDVAPAPALKGGGCRRGGVGAARAEGGICPGPQQPRGLPCSLARPRSAPQKAVTHPRTPWDDARDLITGQPRTDLDFPGTGTGRRPKLKGGAGGCRAGAGPPAPCSQASAGHTHGSLPPCCSLPTCF